MKQQWKAFFRDRAGERFVHRYERTKNYGPLRRGLTLFGGGVLVVVGLILMPLPGPGILIAAVGGAVMSGQSRRVARWLDAVEVWLRRLLRRKR
ncbi:MAG TPA: hypothetical protein VM240_13250 [Verrucomicrobiae bacterium]|nr:hypothetical protein [Verrucomicrobiae bacterium]